MFYLLIKESRKTQISLEPTLSPPLFMLLANFSTNSMLRSEVDKPWIFFSKQNIKCNRIHDIKNRWSYHLVFIRKHTYKVPLKEFLKLFKCLASSSIHMIFGWLDILFKALYQEKNRRNEIILTRLAWAPWVVVVLPLFYWHLICEFFIKTLIIMSNSTDIHRPYVCDPLDPHISLVNDLIDPTTPYCSTFIYYLYQRID